MDSKPHGVLIKDFLVRRMVVDVGLPEKTIRQIIDDAFQSAVKATTTCNSIELSGWGVFHFNQKKAIKMLDKYQSQITLFSQWIESGELTERKLITTRIKLETAQKNLHDLTLRLK